MCSDLTIAISGGIAGGKSEVSRHMISNGVPVYDADSKTKALYVSDPDLIPSLERALGTSLRVDGVFDRNILSSIIFNDSSKLSKVNSIVHPKVLEDFLNWRRKISGPAAIESAIIFDATCFAPYIDMYIWVDAPENIRIQRASSRDNASAEAVLSRARLQQNHSCEADFVIVNDGSLSELHSKVDDFLKKIL